MKAQYAEARPDMAPVHRRAESAPAAKRVVAEIGENRAVSGTGYERWCTGVMTIVRCRLTATISWLAGLNGAAINCHWLWGLSARLEIRSPFRNADWSL
jgi:hypothetical protein